MDTAGYVTLSRQSGLNDTLQVVANNIANLSTAGYRREGVVFAEMVEALPVQGGSVAMTAAHARVTDPAQGALRQSGGTYDLAIEGPGFFTVETPAGPRLTRAGAFTPGPAGELVSPSGHRLLDVGGAPVFVPPDAGTVSIAPDGTVSADGRPLAQLVPVTVADPQRLVREDGVLFRADAPPVPAEGARIVQGALEGANVNPVGEIARMIEVSRAYEAGQRLLDREDERIRQVIDALARG